MLKETMVGVQGGLGGWPPISTWITLNAGRSYPPKV